jgi:hypothetical protein
MPPQGDGRAVLASNATHSATSAAAATTARSARPDISSGWHVDMTCDWPNAHHTERLVARTREASSGAAADTVHRYRGRLQGDEIFS